MDLMIQLQLVTIIVNTLLQYKDLDLALDLDLDLDLTFSEAVNKYIIKNYQL